MALRSKLAAEMMGTATGFHSHHAGRQSRRQLQYAIPAQSPPQQHLPGFIQTDNAANILPQIDTKNLDLIH